MKRKSTYLLIVCIISAVANYAQTNTFPATGNVGIGTLSPATNLQVIGTSRFGSATNYVQINGSGSLSFQGTANYLVGGNKYAFAYSGNPNYGLFFNSTLTRYEFRDGNARPVFHVDANLGDGTFTGGVKVSNSSNTTAGNIRWTGADFEGYNGSSWLSLTRKGWLLTGNAGTNPNTDFIGTTDQQPLILKVNNERSGFIDYSSGNTAFGYQTLLANTTGDWNAAIGYMALKANTTGNYNTAIGQRALGTNTTGIANTALGFLSLYSNQSDYNTAIGYGAMYYNTDGEFNTAIGASAMYGNTTGSWNTAFGFNALFENTTGYSNTGIGYTALEKNTIGINNTAMGESAMRFNTVGTDNAAYGVDALGANTTGSNNASFGSYALFLNTTGSFNTALGRSAMQSNTTATGNVAVGYNSLFYNITGSNNTAVGNASGVFYTQTNLNNTTAIGYGAVADASNKVRIGNSSVTSIGGQVGWTNFSDERVKKDIKENVPGLKFIKALRAVTYHYNIAKENELLGVKDSSGWEGKNDLEKINFSGFLAQEVDAAAKKIGYDFSGVDKTGKIMGLRYAEFVVPLVKAVQELSKMNDDKDAVIQQQQQQLNDVMERLATLEKLANVAPVSTQTASIQTVSSNVLLDQNIPNPANGTTTIRYNIPSNTQSASIMISDVSGHTLKTYALTNKGAGQITLSIAQLAAGNYFYSLIINGQKIATKQMSVLK